MIEYRLGRASEAAEMAQMSRDLVEYGLGWSWTEPRIRRRGALVPTAHHVESDQHQGELIGERNRGLDRPTFLGRLRFEKVIGIPAGIIQQRFAGPAAMVHLQGPPADIISIYINAYLQPIHLGEISIPWSRPPPGLILHIPPLRAFSGEVQVFRVMCHSHSGRGRRFISRNRVYQP